MPVELPFSILDYGLTALAMIGMVAIVYFFTKLWNQQHRLMTDAFHKMTDVLEDLTRITRQIAAEMQSLELEQARTHEEVFRNRELLNRNLDRSAAMLDKAAEIHDAVRGYERDRKADKRQEADVEDWRREK